MEYIEVEDQAEFDVAIGAGNCATVKAGHFKASGNSSVRAYGNSSVEAYENSSVVASGNSSVRASENSSVRAYGNSSVEASGNSSVRAYGNSSVEAYENSSVRASGNSSVVASGNSSVRAYGNSSVEASGAAFIRLFGAKKVIAGKSVVIMEHGKAAYRRGGNVIPIKPPSTAVEWCDYWGADVKSGVALLYKHVKDDFSSGHDSAFKYTPGTIPIAPDWDGGERECGRGLHFSSRPAFAARYNSSGKRYVACPVALTDIVVHKDPDYPDKIKAKGCCGKVYEVDIEGKRIKHEGD